MRRNTAMWDDPPRFYSRAHTAGIITTITICAACVLMAYLKPQGVAGADRVLKDATTGQLFVVDNDNHALRPVYGLTSARLITNQHNTPRTVKSHELNRYPRGQAAGIPGAPYDTPALNATASYWTICDTAEHPTSSHPALTVSVLADKPTYNSDTANPLTGTQSLLTHYRGQTLLVDSKGRHAVDLKNTAITAAINLPPATTPTPLTEALYNALPAADPLTLPTITQAGKPNPFGMDPAITIGTVITDTITSSKQFYIVLTDGAAKINPATAKALRNTNTFGHIDPPAVAADKIAALPARNYPSPLHDVTLIDRAQQPMLCWSWAKTGDATAAPQTTIITGKQLPLTPTQLARKIQQITTNVTVYETGAGRNSDEPTGRYVQIIGPTGAPENRFYIDQAGVRYGLPDSQAGKALGLPNPQLAPWPAIRLLAAGPDLTQANALLEHDTLPNDPLPRQIPNR